MVLGEQCMIRPFFTININQNGKISNEKNNSVNTVECVFNELYKE